MDKSMVAAEMPVLRALADRWWLFLIRGIAAIVFGALSCLWPGVSLLTLVILFGCYALVDGVTSLMAAFTGRGRPGSRWWLGIIGVLGIVAGIMTFAWPGMTAILLLVFIAGWAIAIGVFLIAGGIRLRKEIDNEWMLILSGVLSILLGVVMFVMPGASALALIWMIASWAILFGVLTIGLALRLRRLSNTP